jgi:hypothetical protein
VNGKLKFELKIPHRNIPDKKLIQDLKTVAEELKKNSVTIDEYDNFGTFSSSTVYRRFGSWFAVLKKAKLNKTRNRGISERQLYENLKQVWTKLGRQPKQREVRKPLSKYSYHTYRYRFGGWIVALKKFTQLMKTGGTETLKNCPALPPAFRSRAAGCHPSSSLRLRVLQRDNFKCRFCGRSPATDPKVTLHVDHIKPWCRGGETLFENLQTLCSKCNYGKSDSPHLRI